MDLPHFTNGIRVGVSIYTLIFENCNLQASMRHNLLTRRLERWSNFKIEIFFNAEDVPRIFFFYFNKICNLLLSKVQQLLLQLIVITEKKLYLNLLAANLTLLWVAT